VSAPRRLISRTDVAEHAPAWPAEANGKDRERAMDGAGDVKMTAEEVMAFLDREFPQIHIGGRVYAIDEVGHHRALLRLTASEAHLRPGGTVSGPSMMALADLAMYVALLASVGPVGLAVTTSFNINFLRKPAPGALLGDCRLLKLGKRLAVGEVGIRSEGMTGLVAHVTTTYSIPDR
jgi:uncharacterized protein (TIGR00369 family)